jgi:hypothetical protein
VFNSPATRLPPPFARPLPRHARYVRKAWLIDVAALLFGAALVAFCVYEAFWGSRQGGWITWVFVSSAFFLFLLKILPADIRDSYRVRVVPYFKEPVPGPETFPHGQALARYALWLDQAAAQLAVTPLSHFGYSGANSTDADGWYNAADGLATITALLQFLGETPSPADDMAQLIAELQKIASRLSEASKINAGFCLLLRHGSPASGWELRNRKGHR